MLVKIDEVAEWILTPGYSPNHRYSDYLKESEIQESKYVSDGVTAIRQILDAFTSQITLQREILQLFDVAGDEATKALMSDYIREQEKLVWMYSAYISE